MDEYAEWSLLRLTLRSTHRGFLSRYIVCLFWAGAALGVALTISPRAAASYISLDARMWDWRVDALGCFAAFFIARMLFTLLCRSRERCVFFKQDGRWRMVECVKYRFPFGKTTGNPMFDRITDIVVRENRLGIDRLFGTGTLTVYFATAVGNGATEHGVVVDAVVHPHALKMELRAPDIAFETSPFPAPSATAHAEAVSA